MRSHPIRNHRPLVIQDPSSTFPIELKSSEHIEHVGEVSEIFVGTSVVVHSAVASPESKSSISS
jgi:hypothetical protein